MAENRHAELSIKATLDAKDAASGAREVREEVAKLGDAGSGASSGLEDTAQAVTEVGRAGGVAAENAAEAAQTLAKMGAAGGDAGEEIAAGAGAGASGVANLGDASETAGARIAAGADAAAKTLGNVGDAAEESGAKTDAAGKKAALSLEDVETKAREFKEALSQLSGAPLLEQHAVLVQLEAEFVKVIAANNDTSAAGIAMAAAQRQGLTDVRARIVAVSSELRAQAAQYGGLSTAAQAALLGIGTETQTVEKAIIAAATAIRDVDKQLIESGTIGPAQVAKIAKAYENARQTIAAANDGLENASAGELAALSRLEFELNRVNAKANELTNSSKDNALTLQEQEDAAAGLASALGNLAGSFGAADSGVKAVLSRSSQLFGAFGALKDRSAALNLNVLGGAKGLAGLGGQLGLVAIVAGTAAAAGLKLANANAENREEFEALKKTVLEFFSPLEGLATRFDALQEGRAWASIDAFRVALGRGRAELDLFNLAQRSGLPETEALTLATEENAYVMKFYRDALAAGAEGQALWQKAVNQSGGSALKLAENTRDLRGALDTITASSAAVRGAIADLNGEYKKSPDNTAQLITMAEALEDTTAKTKGLAKVEKERIAIIVDLLKRGPDATKEEKRFAEALLADAAAGRIASSVLNTIIRLKVDLASATDGTTRGLSDSLAVLRELTSEWDRNSQRIRVAIAADQTLLNQTDDLTEAQRRNRQAIIDGLRAVDDARQRSRDLESQRIATLATAEDELKNRTRQTHEQIVQRLTDLRSLIPFSDQYGETIKAIGAQLSELTTRQVHLSASDRERLEILAMLAARGNDLTDSQRTMATTIIDQAAACETSTAAMNVLYDIMSKLDTATNGSTDKLAAQVEALKLLTPQFDLNSKAINLANAEMERLLGNTDGMTAAQQRLYEQVIEGIKSIDDLTRSQKDLEKEQEKLLDLGDRMTKDQYKQYDANQKQIYSLQRQAEAQQGAVAVSLENIKANEQVEISTNKLVKVIEDGKEKWTNIGTEQKETAAVAVAAADEIATAAEQMAVQMGQSLEESASSWKSFLGQFDDGKTKLTGFSDTAKAVAPLVRQSIDLMADPTKLEALNTALGMVEARLGNIKQDFSDLPVVMDDFVRAAARVREAAADAAGNSPGYVNVTEQ